MFQTILQLSLTALIPIALSIVFMVLQVYTRFKNVNKTVKMIIIGVVFGGSSVLGTVIGVPIGNGILVNVRDASPIIAGLTFGGPAGLIAGAIGGVYRFVSVYWGGSGAFTQIACSVSTVLAGVFTALARRFIFNGHHGKWYYGFFLAFLIEDFHMLMVFLTHMDNTNKAYEVVLTCALPMILVNSIAVTISSIATSLINKEKLITKGKKIKAATKVQLTLMASLIACYLLVSGFAYTSLSNSVKLSVQEDTVTAIDDVEQSVGDAIDNYFKTMVVDARSRFNEAMKNGEDLDEAIDTFQNHCAESYGFKLSEVNIVGRDNIIWHSNIPAYVGKFDMTKTKDSNEFTVLNNEVGGIDVLVQAIRSPASPYGGRAKYAGARVTRDDAYNMAYVQIGLYEDKYHYVLDSEVQDSATHRHINNKGFIAVTDENGKIVSTVEGATIQGSIDLNKIEIDKAGRYEYKDSKGNKHSYYTYATLSEGYCIIGFADKEESDRPINMAFMGITLTLIFFFMILYCGLVIVIKHSITNKIEHISEGLTQISEGNLQVQINERNSREFDALSNDINKTVDALKAYALMEKQKNDEELRFARSIQNSVLPSIFPLNDKFEIYADMKTANQVGGDFYDFYYLDHEHIVIQIADVSGKGIPAAMFMMQAKTIIKNLIESGLPIDEAYNEANKQLCEGNDTQMFVTAWIGIINLTNGHVEYVNAGHNPPLVSDERGELQYLVSKRDFVLAGLNTYKYKKQSFDIKPGNVIFLYTDGVTEAMDSYHHLYGEKRLQEVLNTHIHGSAERLCGAVRSDLAVYTKGAEQSDDITMLCFRLNGNESDKIIVVNAEDKNIPQITKFVNDILDDLKADNKVKAQIDVAIDEIVSNINHYAYRPGQAGKVKLVFDFDQEEEMAVLAFEDRGRAYNPLERKDPDLKLSIEEREAGGLGIFIVKKTMDEVHYENVNGHNLFVVRKRIH